MNETMRCRGRWVPAVVAVGLLAGACGDGGAGAVGGGEEGAPTSGPVAVVTSDMPSYCEPLRQFGESGPVSNEEFLERMISFSRLVVADGPEDLVEDYTMLVEGFEKLDAVFATHGYDTDLDTVELTDAEEGDLLLGALALVSLENLDDSLSKLSVECGLDESASSLALVAPESLAPTGTTVAPPTTAAGTTSLVGPFGAGIHGHVELSIASVFISDVGFDDWGDEGATPANPDASHIYVTLEITNLDPNDAVPVAPGDLELLVDGVPSGIAQQVNISEFGEVVAAQASVEREYGWEIDASVVDAGLALRYGGESVPVVIPFDADAAPTGYPIVGGPAGSGSYFHGKGCSFELTVDIAQVSYLLDVPADYSSAPAPASNRARAGERLVSVEGSVTAGSSDCAGATAVINTTNLRLLIDGSPVEPLAAPNEFIFPNEALEVAILWSIPVDAREIVFRAIGAEGDELDLPLPLPVLPPVDGE